MSNNETNLPKRVGPEEALPLMAELEAGLKKGEFDPVTMYNVVGALLNSALDAPTIAETAATMKAEALGFVETRVSTMIVRDLVAAGHLPQDTFLRYADELRGLASKIKGDTPNDLFVCLTNTATNWENASTAERGDAT